MLEIKMAEFDNISCTDEKKYIPIVYGTDANYIFPTIISIMSALQSRNNGTYYKFYILISRNVDDIVKQKFSFLYDIYDDFEINFVEMGQKFEDCKSMKLYWTTATYYNLSISGILADEGKCIYLDGDTYVAKDLSQLFDINMDKYYVAGCSDVHHKIKYNKLIALKCDKYINVGVLLMNLKKMREDDIEAKYNEFLQSSLAKHFSLFINQDAINYVCHNKLLNLPFKFNAMIHLDYFSLRQLAQKCYTEDEWREGIADPVIVHYTWRKPWRRLSHEPEKFELQKKWWRLARRTPYFDGILKKYIEPMRPAKKAKFTKMLDELQG
jgi:lipopolysaccharide biosynthesis glycosyltransferase